MSILNWIEDKLDKITPKIEITGYTNRKFSIDEFQLFIKKLLIEPYFTLRSNTDNECIINVIGNTFGDLTQAKVLFGVTPKPNMYKNMKSRFRITYEDDCRLKIQAFEHFIAFEKERVAFKTILSMRLDILINHINENN